jgi:hypothetical protein
MKTAFFVICVLCASAAFGQVAAVNVSAQPQIYSFDSHPEHASRQPMAEVRSINGGETYVYAQGERPLWELATPSHEVPLGDSARLLRQEHATAQKAARCWQNY